MFTEQLAHEVLMGIAGDSETDIISEETQKQGVPGQGKNSQMPLKVGHALSWQCEPTISILREASHSRRHLSWILMAQGYFAKQGREYLNQKSLGCKKLKLAAAKGEACWKNTSLWGGKYHRSHKGCSQSLESQEFKLLPQSLLTLWSFISLHV